jgi:hypothetical protein
MKIYRAEGEGAGEEVRKRRLSTRRAPLNVPYLVDNLWEWTRPDGYPNRRHSLFAAPSREAAAENAYVPEAIYEVCALLPSDAMIAQIRGVKDARFHPDCRALQRKLLELLGSEWTEESIEGKKAIAPLWVPCLLKEEVEAIMPWEIREEMRRSVTLWKDVALLPFDLNGTLADDTGEVFLEADEVVLRRICGD